MSTDSAHELASDLISTGVVGCGIQVLSLPRRWREKAGDGLGAGTRGLEYGGVELVPWVE